ncbi:MAG: transposase [Flavisolibacter sp.]
MKNYFPPLQTDAFYHLYNRGNNREKIFFNKENYRYFLKKFDEYLSPYLDVFAYCLLPNHFHFLIKTRETTELIELTLKKGSDTLLDFSIVISEVFRRFFLSYAKAIKIQEGRTGSLFEKNFRRIMVESDQHLVWLVNYIHRNPQTHGLIPDFRNYSYSSYQAIIADAPTKVKREEVIKLFGNRDEFERFHLTNPITKEKWLIE